MTRKYDTTSLTTKTDVNVSKMIWGKFKLIFGLKGQDKSEGMTEAIHLYNEKHKKVLE